MSTLLVLKITFILFVATLLLSVINIYIIKRFRYHLIILFNIIIINIIWGSYVAPHFLAKNVNHDIKYIYKVIKNINYRKAGNTWIRISKNLNEIDE